MKNSEHILEELLRILALIITLAFTSSNFSAESLIDEQSWDERLLAIEQIN